MVNIICILMIAVGTVVLGIGCVKYYGFLRDLKAQLNSKRIFGSRVYFLCFVLIILFMCGYIAEACYVAFAGSATVQDFLIASILLGGAVFVRAIVSLVIRFGDTEQLKHRLEQEELMSKISQSFTSHKDHKQLIHEALALSAGFMRADHAFLSEYDSENCLMNCKYEYCGPKARPFIGGGESWPFTSDIELIKDLNKNGYIAVDNFCPCDDANYAVVKDYGFRSFMSIPIEISGELWGLLGFILYNEPHRWDRSNIRLGQLLAGIFSGAISRNIAEEKLIAAKELAEQGSLSKSEFLSHMSHEMRTPLNAVLGLSELVLSDGGLSEKNVSHLDHIFSAGATLLSIVNDILDISKIEAGKFEFVLQEYDVPSLINDAINQNILRIQSKPIHFSLNIGDDVPARLRGDELRVKQIINNLLSNAFKYTEKGSVELGINCEREGSAIWMTIRVCDTGVGIQSADFDSLFADYTRLNERVNKETSGTGLGLPITKRLAELMDGSVRVESEYGKGSVFTARIRQWYVNDTIIGQDLTKHLKNFHYSINKRHRGSQLKRVRIPYARVLVVDDNLTNLDIAKGLMQPYEMSIDCVMSGQEAIDAIRAGNIKYNAIFMDHMMPGIDGMEAVRIIREEIGSEYAKTIPIIALTANAIVGNEELFISRGFNAFVSKPIDIFRLDEVIRKWIWDKEQSVLLENPRAFAERRNRPDRRKGGDRRVTERRSTPLASAQAIEGLDWMKGIEMFGDVDSFHQVLRSFAVNTKPLLDSVSAPDAESLPQYAITVHGIKSSSRSIGAAAIGSMAESLEFAAKDGNLHFVIQRNPDFITATGKLIADIETLLNKKPETDSKPLKTSPDNAELKRLRAACEVYNMDEIEAVMQKIESYEYTADGGLTMWLRDNIAKLNYTQVIEKILQTTGGL